MARRITIEVANKLSPWAERIMQIMPDWRRKALKSAGWMVAKEIKSGIASGAPGGQRYKERMARARGRKLSKILGHQAPTDRTLGKLARAIGYRYYNDTGTVVVGWLSASAARLGAIHEKGRTIPVTTKVRRAFFAAGLGMRSSKTSIEIPARPTIEPMARMLKDRIPNYVQQKLGEYLEKSPPASAQPKLSKYVIHGGNNL